MKNFVLALLLALIGGAGAQNLGKTEAQIIAMGPARWQALFTSKVGDSTADMCRANEIYGLAVTHRNDRLLQDQLDGDFAGQVRKCRTLLSTYGSSCIDLGYAFTGGGTMWNPVYAGITGEAEMAIYGLLSDRAKLDKHRVVSDVTKLIAQIEQKLAKVRKKHDAPDWINYNDAEKSLKLLRSTFNEIVQIAAKMSRKDSDHLLSFCITYAKVALEQAQ